MKPAYEIRTFEDLVEILRSEPKWREELRRLILTDDLLELPKQLQEFKEEFQDFKEDFQGFKEDFQGFKEEFQGFKEEFQDFREEFQGFKAEFQDFKEEFQGFKEEFQNFKEDFQGFKAEFQEFKEKVEERFERLESDVVELKGKVGRLENDVAEIKGDNFERKVREKAPSFLGKMIIKCKVVDVSTLAEKLDDALYERVITEEERGSALNLDVVAEGFLREDREKKVLVAVEVSIKADRRDVERARERSEILEKVFGLPVIPVVIGKAFTKGAKERAKELKVDLIKHSA